MTFIFRKSRKGEDEKIARFLRKVSNADFRVNTHYYVITTDNPDDKKKRLIISVMEIKDSVVKEFGVYSKWVTPELFDFIGKEIPCDKIKLNNIRYLRAAIQAGWVVWETSKSGISFTFPSNKYGGLNRYVYSPFENMFVNLKVVDLIGKLVKKYYKPQPKPEKSPYILGEKQVSIFEFFAHDKKFRKIQSLKPIITLYSYDVRDILPKELKRIEIPATPITDKIVLTITKELTTLNSDMYYKLNSVDTRNKLIKRLENYLKPNSPNVKTIVSKLIWDEFKYRLTNYELQELGNTVDYLFLYPKIVQYKFTSELDWYAGKFGDSNSCWLSNKNGYRAHNSYDYRYRAWSLFATGGGAVQLYKEDGSPLGRFFVDVEDDDLVFMNYRTVQETITPYRLGKALASDLGLNHYPIYSEDGEIRHFNYVVKPNYELSSNGLSTPMPDNLNFVLSRNKKKSNYNLTWFERWDGKVPEYAYTGQKRN